MCRLRDLRGCSFVICLVVVGAGVLSGASWAGPAGAATSGREALSGSGATATVASTGSGSACGSVCDPVSGPRVLATIDGVAVTEADADALRAILQPPPSKEKAERLAVDAALAWWDLYGWLAGSSAQGRLDAWRSWLVAGEDLGHDSVVAAVEDLNRRVRVGESGSPQARRALELNRRSGREARAVSLRWFRFGGEDDVEVRVVSLPLRWVDPVLATTVARTQPGEVTGPLMVATGVFWVQRD